MNEIDTYPIQRQTVVPILKFSNPYRLWHKASQDSVVAWSSGCVRVQGRQLNGLQLADWIVQELLICSDSQQSFLSLLSQVNGHYAIVVQTDHTTLAAVDRLRSIPLFFHLYGDRIMLADMAAQATDIMTYDLAGCENYLLAGFVSGRKTLLCGVEQILPGEYIKIEHATGTVQRKCYYQYLHLPETKHLTGSQSIGKYVSSLKNQIGEVFADLVESCADHRIVVPLSGGWDSRLVVAMLYKMGVKNVLCFSYGVPNNPEAVSSRSVAESLGYAWKFVPYTRASLAQDVFSGEMREYWEYAANYSSAPVFSNWPALKSLLRDGILNQGDIFVPGHSGDFLAGSHINWQMLQSVTLQSAVTLIIDKHFSLWPCTKAPDGIVREIQEFVGQLPLASVGDKVDTCECWDWQERQGKLIANSCRVFEYWGFDWRLPLWNHILMDFYSSVPLEYRLDCHLYYATLSREIFCGMTAPLSRIPLADGRTPEECLHIIENTGRTCLLERLVKAAKHRIFLNVYRHLKGHRPNPLSQASILMSDSYFSCGALPSELTVKDVVSRHFDVHDLPSICGSIMGPNWNVPLDRVGHFGMLSLMSLLHIVGSSHEAD